MHRYVKHSQSSVTDTGFTHTYTTERERETRVRAHEASTMCACVHTWSMAARSVHYVPGGVQAQAHMQARARGPAT